MEFIIISSTQHMLTVLYRIHSMFKFSLGNLAICVEMLGGISNSLWALGSGTWAPIFFPRSDASGMSVCQNATMIGTEVQLSKPPLLPHALFSNQNAFFLLPSEAGNSLGLLLTCVIIVSNLSPKEKQGQPL